MNTTVDTNRLALPIHQSNFRHCNYMYNANIDQNNTSVTDSNNSIKDFEF